MRGPRQAPHFHPGEWKNIFAEDPGCAYWGEIPPGSAALRQAYGAGFLAGVLGAPAAGAAGVLSCAGTLEAAL